MTTPLKIGDKVSTPEGKGKILKLSGNNVYVFFWSYGGMRRFKQSEVSPYGKARVAARGVAAGEVIQFKRKEP
jgi:hypothetical protein